MSNLFTIPKKLIQKGELVIVPRSEYEEVFNMRKRLLREERDTDESIRIFEKERKAGKLKRASNFTEIFGARRSSR